MKHQKLTLNQLKWNEEQLKKCTTISDIALLLNCTKNQLNLLTFNPVYYHFTVPKKNGKFRIIEAPSLELKNLQRNLNVYLQAVYYLNQSKASYGYVLKIEGSKISKNIYSNALQHLGNNFMLNADFEDFFHQITISDVATLFKSSLFNFDNYTAHSLAKLCCYKGRLPMGAPTSPVLSNLFCIGFDNEIEHWASSKNINFTRYVDDLTLSSNAKQFTAHDFNYISTIALKYQLKFNSSKTIYATTNDVKKVTGLVLNSSVDIDPDYYIELEKDIARLKSVMEVYHITGKVQNITFLKTFKQELFGKINFISTIEGKSSKEYLSYLNWYYKALQPNTDLVQRWTKFSTYI